MKFASRLDPDNWHIFHNGASIVHAASNETISIPLASRVVDECAEIADRHGWVIEYYSAADYTVDTAADLAVAHAELLGVDHLIRDRTTLPSVIVRLQFVVPLEVLDWVNAELADVDAEVVHATAPGMPGVAFVSCTSPGVSKSSAIQIVAGRLGIDVDQVMMVGDGLNDLEAIRTVGHGVAMGNAAREVLVAARHVVADVTNDGLVQALAMSALLD